MSVWGGRELAEVGGGRCGEEGIRGGSLPRKSPRMVEWNILEENGYVSQWTI